jgi:hypothetical protein
MKLKKLTTALILLNLMMVVVIASYSTSYKPINQANGDYKLGIKVGDEFEFTCTEFNTPELFNVLGGDWQSNIASFLWWTGYAAPNDLGDRAKFEVFNITENADYWWPIIDGWSWINKSSTFDLIPDGVSHASYSLPKNASGGMWNPSVWILSLPVVNYLSELIIGVNYTLNENLLTYTGFDTDIFSVNWLYDKNTGVVKNFKIRNAAEVTILELSSPTSSKDGIPGYSLYILISTVIVLISFASVILLKKIKWK